MFQVAQTHLDFNWQHLNEEEGSLLPLARRDLSIEDWAAIDAEFAKYFDPYAGGGGGVRGVVPADRESDAGAVWIGVGHC